MSTTISGGIFNFTKGGYIPPTWSGSYYNFTHGYTLLQIYSTNDYIYGAHHKGLAIFDPSTDKFCAYATISGGFTTVAGNTDRVYLGYNGGIKYISTATVSGNTSNPYDLSNHLEDFTIRNITNSGIKYIHVNGSYIGICTNSGVDYLSLYTNPIIHSKSFIAGAEKCFVLPNSLYYTISGTNSSCLYIQNNCLCDWTEPSKQYCTGSGIFESGIKLTDIYITENTAENNIDNTIFCATTSGIYVIDEASEVYAIYYTEN